MKGSEEVFPAMAFHQHLVSFSRRLDADLAETVGSHLLDQQYRRGRHLERSAVGDSVVSRFEKQFRTSGGAKQPELAELFLAVTRHSQALSD